MTAKVCYVRKNWWQDYYGSLNCKTYALGMYYPLRMTEKREDQFSRDINDSKCRDISYKFAEDFVQLIKSKGGSLGNCIITIVPNSLGGFSPTMIGIARKVSEATGVTYENIIKVIDPLTTPRRSQKPNANEKYKLTKAMFGITRPLSDCEKKIILLDDTRVTGLTALACAKILIGYGAKEVIHFTLGGEYDKFMRWKEESI